MREMVNGCCVCLDEKGYAENPLVYCDGVGCNIAVHQACYGIVSVPTGNWYCRKCESQEKPSRIRCELCPSKDGALKRTDNGGWAHVVCALYIPEVRFASVTTMEPIMVSQIPSERFNKLCYICRASDRHSKASVGACMQCNKIDCKLYFHVTCAQSLGLLCEEEGIHLDNVNYCGYCQEHYSKLKKSSSPKLFAGSFMQAACVLQQQQQPRELHNNDINISNDNQNQSSIIITTASKRNTPIDLDKLVDNKPNVIANSSNDLIITPQYVFTEDRSKKLKIERESPPPSSCIDMLDLQQNDDESTDMNDDDVQLKFTEEPNLTIVAADSVPKLSPAVVSASDSSTDVSVSSVPPCLATSTFSTSVVTVNSIINDVSATCSSSSTVQPIESTGKDCSALENKSQQPKNTNTVSVVITENNNNNNNSSNNNNNNNSSISNSNNNNNGNKNNIPFHQSALINAPHMLGNQLNPSSTMARKMCDTLYAEIEDHSIYNESEELKPELSTDLIGPQLYSKIISSVQSNLINLQSNMSFSNQIPQTLEQLLERQWEQGRSIDRTTHFDLASLLAGLHQISSENSRLDEYIKNMQSRINHLTEENRKLQEMIKIETAEQ